MEKLTKKLIAETCLPVYYEVIEKGNDMDADNFMRLLYRNNAMAGICLLFQNTAKSPDDIYSFKYLKNKNGCIFIYTPPMYCKTKTDMLKCIQVRIDLLESWLKQ